MRLFRVSRSRRCSTSRGMTSSPVPRAWPPEVGRQEVVDGSLPAAHAGSHRLLLDVLRESRPLLGEFGVEGGGHVAHGVQRALVALEERLLSVLPEVAPMRPSLASASRPLWLGTPLSRYSGCSSIQAGSLDGPP